MQNPFNPTKVKVLKIGTATVSTVSSSSGVIASVTNQSQPATTDPVIASTAKQSQSQNRKLDQVEREIKRVRYERSQVHLKYRDLLNHELLPKAPKADFLVIYEEIEALSDELRRLYIKKRQIELTGDFRESKPLDDATQNKIDALKNEKKSVSNIKNKTQKGLQKAKIEGDTKNVLKYEKKLDELDLRWLELESMIEKLTHV